MNAADLQAVRQHVAVARELIAAGWTQGTHSRDLDPASAEQMEQRWPDRYSPFHRPDRDATDRAIRMVAEVVYGEPIPAGIQPAAILSNFNEREGQTAEAVIEAFDATLRRLDAQLTGQVAHA